MSPAVAAAMRLPVIDPLFVTVTDASPSVPVAFAIWTARTPPKASAYAVCSATAVAFTVWLIDPLFVSVIDASPVPAVAYCAIPSATAA